MIKKFLHLIIVLCSLSYSSFSQIVINEYSCSNVSTIQDNFNNFEDWIELYNKGNSSVNLAGYYLSDDAATPLKWAIPAGTIPAQGFVLIFASGLDSLVGSTLHANFKLTQTKFEPIILSSPTGVFIDSIGTKPAQANHSRGRKTDGATVWSLFTNPTPEATNSGSDLEYTARPVMNKNAGFYSGSVSVTITCSTANTTIYYSEDGSTPDASSTVYSGPVSISTTTVLRAIAIDNNNTAPASFVESNTYFIDAPHLMPVISLFGDQVATLLNGSQIDPLAVLEYFDKNGIFQTEANGTANEHGNDSWAYDQRGLDFITRDQQGYNNALKAKLFTIKDRKSFQRIILKAAANDNYPSSNGGAHIRDSYVTNLAILGNMHLDGRTSAYCVVYVNGNYWGIYDLREKADDSDYTDYYYHQDENHIQYLKTWGGTWSEYGGPQSQADWTTFRNFVNANNMAVPANYNYVDSVYSVKSLTDYFILNSYVVCTDWLNWNTSWWRGLDPNGDGKKWKYALWDEDATFGHYINYTNVPSTAPTANPCNAENLPNPGGQGHTQIMKKLLNNLDFKQYYVSRYIDLTNTVLSCDYMLHVLDSMVAIIAPEMPAHCARWNGTVTQWQTNVQSLRNFINNRCVGVQTGMNSCYTLSGPYDFCIDVEPQGAGTVTVNSTTFSNLPDSLKYYGGIKTFLLANPIGDYSFDHWEITSTDTIHNSVNDSSVYVKITKDACMKAVFTTEKKPEIESIITNVFSPNGDGFNDLFTPISPIQDFMSPVELTVTDRWGKVVFKTSDLKTGWDGKSNGKTCENGTYYWLVKYLDSNAEFKVDKGFVSLLK